MKIVDYKTFVSLPKGTLYRETEPCTFGELQIKQETINEGRDWFLTRLDYIKESNSSDDFLECYKQMENGQSLNLDIYCKERDGMFDYDRKFLVYENKDVIKLIELLNKCINNDRYTW